MTIGEVTACLAVAGIAGCLCIGVYFVGERDGYSQATLKCQSASQASELKAEHDRYINLRAQMKAQAAVIARNESDKRKTDELLASAKTRVATVTVTKDCSIGPDAIDAMNSVRKAGAE